MLALFAGSPATAQPPPRPLPGQPGVVAPQFPARGVNPAAGGMARPGAPAPNPAGGPPAGYRQVGGTREAPPPAAEQTGPAGGGGGKVMYFHKPADALTANLPADDANLVAIASGPGVPATGVPDVPVALPGIVPTLPRPPVVERPISTPETVPVPTAPAAQPEAALTVLPLPGQPPPAQPGPTIPLDLKKSTQLPGRDQIFMMYDDAALEKAILERVRLDLSKGPAGKKADPGRFPPLPSIVPEGTTYVAKTVGYPPHRAVYEPGFVAHRRLHFEEKNAERYGWDLGIIQPVVSTVAFYRDTLLWPNSLASGCVYGFWDTNAGKCLPGSPVPYYLYPPGLTITGTAFEAAVITGVAVIIP